MATVVAVLLSVVAVWVIIGSPDQVDEVSSYFGATAESGEAVSVAIEPGEAPEDIGNSLESAGAIESSTQFQVLVGLLGYDALLQAGEYEFDRGTPPLEAVYRIRRGETTARVVAVIPGWRIGEVADSLAAQDVSSVEFTNAAVVGAYDFPFLADLDPGTPLEGYLYPATYPIGRLEPPPDIVQRMLQAFSDNVPSDIAERAAAVGLTSHQAVTLASIIEREAVVPEERPVMAQVFLSRIAEGIPLAADPTVQFAVATPESVAEFGWWKAELTRADLENESPYNTYYSTGLPPGPISSPSVESIEAVLAPADTNYLYFVAKGDGTGSHAFAETFDEHLENVRLYLGE